MLDPVASGLFHFSFFRQPRGETGRCTSYALLVRDISESIRPLLIYMDTVVKRRDSITHSSLFRLHAQGEMPLGAPSIGTKQWSTQGI